MSIVAAEPMAQHAYTEKTPTLSKTCLYESLQDIGAPTSEAYIRNAGLFMEHWHNRFSKHSSAVSPIVGPFAKV